MQQYLTRALKDDVSDSDLMNVIRIILHKPITKQGVEGEDHYKAIQKKHKDSLNKYFPVEIEHESNEINEDEELEEIIASYTETTELKTNHQDSKKIERKIANTLKRDKKLFKLLADEES